jgi:hypothetical protein
MSEQINAILDPSRRLEQLERLTRELLIELAPRLREIKEAGELNKTEVLLVDEILKKKEVAK